MIIKIDHEFKSLIPPLRKDELEALETDLRAHGCLSPLVYWNNEAKDIILDGHNRYEICNRLKITFNTRKLNFATRDEAKLWILTNQLARRNVKPDIRVAIAAKITKLMVKKSREEQHQSDSQDMLPQSLGRTVRPKVTEVTKKRKKRTVQDTAKWMNVPQDKLQAATKLSDEALDNVIAGVVGLPHEPRKESRSDLLHKFVSLLPQEALEAAYHKAATLLSGQQLETLNRTWDAVQDRK